jgi:cold-inducible RNA-binding protein
MCQGRRQEGRLTKNSINSIVFRAIMARKLFVGGLPYRTTGEELRDAFAQAGEVASASIVTDRETGRSRGFGFVEMVNDSDAEAAISMWNGKDFGGRMLTVSEARPKAQ